MRAYNVLQTRSCHSVYFTHLIIQETTNLGFDALFVRCELWHIDGVVVLSQRSQSATENKSPKLVFGVYVGELANDQLQRMR